MFRITVFSFFLAITVSPVTPQLGMTPDLQSAVYYVAIAATYTSFVLGLWEAVLRFNFRVFTGRATPWFSKVYQTLFPVRSERDDLKEMTKTAEFIVFRSLWTPEERAKRRTLFGIVYVSSGVMVLLWMLSIDVVFWGRSYTWPLAVTMSLLAGVIGIALSRVDQLRLEMRAKYDQRYETEFETVPLYDGLKRLKGVAVRSRITSDPVHTIARESA